MSQVYTTRETANLLRITDRTVRQWIKDGKLPAVKVGSGWRIQKADLDQLLKIE